MWKDAICSSARITIIIIIIIIIIIMKIIIIIRRKRRRRRRRFICIALIKASITKCFKRNS